MNQKNIAISILLVSVLLSGALLWSSFGNRDASIETGYPEYSLNLTKEALAARFEYLSQQGSNSCGGGKDVVNFLSEDGRMQGSCCGAMSMHSYEEQIESLKKYSKYKIIPPDPYDVEVSWARQMIEYGENTDLSDEQQALYDKAVAISHEGGPCCCVCWHWYAYEGLAKHLIINEGFSEEEIAEIWDISDACGGEHAHH